MQDSDGILSGFHRGRTEADLRSVSGSAAKGRNNEISTKPLDLRGLIGALKTIRGGLSPRAAIRMGIVNKSFDLFEREIVEDIVMTRIPESWTPAEIFL